MNIMMRVEPTIWETPCGRYQIRFRDPSGRHWIADVYIDTQGTTCPCDRSRDGDPNTRVRVGVANNPGPQGVGLEHDPVVDFDS